MAGNAKPITAGLNIEATYTVHGVSGSQGSGGTISNPGLFNGITIDEWNTANVMYWYGTSNYIDITINQPCNIWRSGTAGWKQYTAPFIIEKFDNSIWTVVAHTQTITQITHLQWEKTITNLPSGRYRFKVGAASLRMDSEWYLEQAVTLKFLIQDGLLLKNIVEGNLTTVCNTTDGSTAIETAFLTNGMGNLSSWNNSLINQIVDKPAKIAIYKK